MADMNRRKFFKLAGAAALTTQLPPGVMANAPIAIEVSDGSAGWLLMEGQSLPRSAYSALFSVLGTTYGTNDIEHFNLPDLRNRVSPPENIQIVQHIIKVRRDDSDILPIGYILSALLKCAS